MNSNAKKRRQWAKSRIRRAQQHGPIPPYGSPEWHRLHWRDERRWAAVIIAAECWQQDGDELTARLRRELTDEFDANERIEAELFAEMAAGVRAMANRPTQAQTEQRRRDAYASRPARTPQQIRAESRHSWSKYDRRVGAA